MPPTDPARYARIAAEAMGATFEDLDAGGGYLFSIARNGRRVLAGAGPIASFPINSAVSVSIARDKAFTKTVLAKRGLPVIPGGLFFAHKGRVALRDPGRELEDAPAFADRLGWPVFVKPNAGARGNFAEIARDRAELLDYAARIALEFEAFLIEPVIRGREHRVLVHDGRIVFHAAKRSASLLGDGRSSVRELLAKLNAAMAGSGVSPWPLSIIQAAGRAWEDVLANGEGLTLPGRRNLSAVGDIDSFSLEAPPALAALARAAVDAVGLRIGAVDVFDRSLEANLSDLLVVEVNGNPGLKTLELAGRADLITSLWIAMLRDALGAS